MIIKAKKFSINVLNEIIFNYRCKVLKWKQHVENGQGKHHKIRCQQETNKHNNMTANCQQSGINQITKRVSQWHDHMTENPKCQKVQNIAHAKYAINPCMKTHSALSWHCQPKMSTPQHHILCSSHPSAKSH